MIVYLLGKGQYSDSGPVAIFSSEEKARETAAAIEFHHPPTWFRKEYELYVKEFKRLGRCPVHGNPPSDATFVDDTGKTIKLHRFPGQSGGPFWCSAHFSPYEHQEATQCPEQPETAEEAAFVGGEYWIQEYEIDGNFENLDESLKPKGG